MPETDREDVRTVTLSPPILFKPFALLFWGLSPGAYVHQLESASKKLLAGSVPASMFEAEVDWPLFQGSLVQHPRHLGVPSAATGRFFRFDFDALAPGQPLSLELEGYFAHGVIVGRVLADDAVVLEQSA